MDPRGSPAPGAIRGISVVRGLHLTGLFPQRPVHWWAVHARGLPANDRRRRWHLAGPAAGDDVAVSHWGVPGREFEHSLEHHPATPGAASVEAKHELIQVAGEMRVGDRPLVGAKQPPLGQRGDSEYCGQQLAWVLSMGPSGDLTARLVMSMPA